MIKQYNTLLIDMYGVIIKQRNGVVGYAYENAKPSDVDRLRDMFKNTDIFRRLNLGQLTTTQFFAEIGFEDPEWHLKNLVENYLSFDTDFIPFVESIKDKYDVVLLSNDDDLRSRYITSHFGIDKYFKDRFVSGALGVRKPDFAIYDLALERLGKSPAECIFVDDRVENLLHAEEVGISPILFNRDDSHYDGATVYSFAELRMFIG